MSWVTAIVATALLSLATPAAVAQEPSGSARPDNPFAGTGAVPGSGVGRRIGVAVPDRLDAWSELVLVGVREEAETAGAELVTCPGTGSANRDPCVEAAGRRVEPDVILDLRGVHAADGQAACLPGRIPTIAVDRSPSRCASSVIGVDGTEAGRLAGEAAGARLRTTSGCDLQLVILVPPLDEVPTLGDRLSGLRDGLLDACETLDPDRIVTIAADDPDPAATAATLIAELPPASAVVGLAADDRGALTLLHASRSGPHVLGISIAGVGGLPSTWSAMACEPAWIAQAALIPERYGRTLVPAALAAAGTGRIADRLVTPVMVLDAGSIRATYPDVPACD